ncbi:MAG: transposase [Clostridia bacterium]|nr:transposase [Clostridia bacterium]
MEINIEATAQQIEPTGSSLNYDYSIEEAPEDKYPIRSIFQLFGKSVLNDKSIALTSEQKKALFCIANCRTGEFGYNAEMCPKCKKLILRPRSCNNRSCPNCQSVDEKQWVELRKAEVIEGLPYYHVVITVPSELYPLALANQSLFYRLLMKAAPDTLLELCRSKEYGSFTPSLISVLHSWSSKMLFHPHVHMILSGGGLTSDGKLKEAPLKNDNKFFIPENVVAALFRGKLMAGLKEAYEDLKIRLILPSSPEENLEDPRQWMNFCDKLYNTKWVAFLKETFNGNGNAIEYLGRYVYRTAISNSRILSFIVDEDHPEGQVKFKYKDYADGNQEKEETVTGKEFILRFLTHVLPKGVRRVRYSGLLSNACKQKRLKQIAEIQQKTYLISVLKGKKKSAVIQFLFGDKKHTCPCCGVEMESCGIISKKAFQEMNEIHREAG